MHEGGPKQVGSIWIAALYCEPLIFHFSSINEDLYCFTRNVIAIT